MKEIKIILNFNKNNNNCIHLKRFTIMYIIIRNIKIIFYSITINILLYII